MQALTIRTITDCLSPVFKNHHVHRAILFGSVAKGTAHPGSDLDLYVESELKGLRFLGLLEDVCTAINMDVDLLDASHVEEGSLVHKEILNTGVVIYEE